MLTLPQRIEELGWDREERSYYVLDDSRLYRRTEPPLPAAPKAKSKSNTLKAQAARRRASKRRRIETSETPEAKDGESSTAVDTRNGEDTMNGDDQVDTFGGFKWECIAVTSEQYREFLGSIERSRDPNEQELHLRIVEQVLPVVGKVEESHRRKMERKQRELLNVQKLTGAKRSGRLADKHERERQEREAVEAAHRNAAELAAAHREQERQSRMEQDRQSRMMTREQRIKDREFKRLLHEEELAKMAEEAKRVEAGEARASERHLKAQIEKHKRDIEDLSAKEDWVFDCSGCGVYGKNVVRYGSSTARHCPRLISNHRTTVHTASLVRNVMFGSTVNAWAFAKSKQRRMTSILSAKTASRRRKMRSGRISRSNFVPGYRSLHHRSDNDMPQKTLHLQRSLRLLRYLYSSCKSLDPRIQTYMQPHPQLLLAKSQTASCHRRIYSMLLPTHQAVNPCLNQEYLPTDVQHRAQLI